MPRVTFSKLPAGTGGTISGVSIASIGASRVAVTGRDSAGKLYVAVWDISASGAVRVGKGSAGSVGDLSVAGWSTSAGKAQVVTAYKSSTGKLGMIAWDVAADGSITRAGEANQDLAVTQVAVAGSAKGVMTAVRTADGNLAVVAWKVNQGKPAAVGVAKAGAVSEVSIGRAASHDGNERYVTAVRNEFGNFEMIGWEASGLTSVKRLGETTGKAASSISVAAMPATAPGRRVAATMRDANGSVRVIAVKIDAAGALVRDGQGVGGGCTEAAVTMFRPDAHSYAVTGVRTDSGDLKLIGWRVGVDVERVGDLADAKVTEVAMATWSGGVVAAVRTAAGTLEVRPFAAEPRGVRTLYASWGPVEKSATAVSPPLTGAPYSAKGSPALALQFVSGTGGPDHMVAAGHQHVVVTDASRLRFYDRSGQPLGSWTHANDFFGTFLADTLPDGSPNPASINAVAGIPASLGIPIVEAYDVRVAYASGSKRFVVLANVRNKMWWDEKYDEDLRPYSRRYLALAVSKTQDPRDGFHQWIVTESNYADWPRLGLAAGMVILGHNDKKTREDGEKPVAYVFNLQDLKVGTPDPVSFVYYPEHVGVADTDGGNVIPVSHIDASSGLTFLVQPRGKTLKVWGFKKPSGAWLASQPVGESTSLAQGIWIPAIPYFHADRLVMSSVVEHADVDPKRRSLKVIRVPANGTAQGFDLGPAEEIAIGGSSASYSYEQPACAVNQNGDIVVVFGRSKVAGGDFPELRYCVIHHHESAARTSRLLYTAACDPGTYPRWLQRFDHAGAAPDPDGESVWFTHGAQTETYPHDEEGLRANYEQVIGAVRVVAGP